MLRFQRRPGKQRNAEHGGAVDDSGQRAGSTAVATPLAHAEDEVRPATMTAPAARFGSLMDSFSSVFGTR